MFGQRQCSSKLTAQAVKDTLQRDAPPLCRAAWQRMNASALLPRDVGSLPSNSGCSTSSNSDCILKLPEQAPLSLPQLSTPQLRALAAYSGLQSADAPRPALLGSLKSELSREGKQQWVVRNAEVSHQSSGKLSIECLSDSFFFLYIPAAAAAELMSGSSWLNEVIKGTRMLESD